MGRVFVNGPGDLGSIPCCFIPKTIKMVLDTSLTLSNIRYISRVKWSNPGKGVAPSPTPRCSSYWKGSLLVALDYDHQIYLLISNHIAVCKLFVLGRNTWLIELLMFYNNTWNHLTVCKQMISTTFKSNVSLKLLADNIIWTGFCIK